MKVGFFGGCFNPPTNVHIDIANELINNKIVEKVIFVPIGDFYIKKDLIPIDKRCKMLEIAINGYTTLEIDDFEKNIKNTIYAKDAFKIITKKYKKNDIYFIMGSDNFLKMNKWEAYNEIVDLYNYIVIKRDKTNLSYTKGNVLIFEPKKQYNFDSTTIRRLINEGKNIDNLVNTGVLKYIRDNNLYMN